MRPVCVWVAASRRSSKGGWRARHAAMGRARWNHNLHYHPLLIDAVPPGSSVLDVGCGEGMLTRELAGRARSVLGVDLDAPSIELARASTSEANVEFLCADVLQHPFEPAGFDAVVSVATLHHL